MDPGHVADCGGNDAVFEMAHYSQSPRACNHSFRPRTTRLRFPGTRLRLPNHSRNTASNEEQCICGFRGHAPGRHEHAAGRREVKGGRCP